jgi:Flp pilus assembly pilin Flp
VQKSSGLPIQTNNESEFAMITPVKSVLRHSSFQNFQKDNRGVTSVEYVIILVVVACLAITFWKGFGTSIQEQVKASKTDVEGLR